MGFIFLLSRTQTIDVYSYIEKKFETPETLKYLNMMISFPRRIIFYDLMS